ncbi:MAG: methyltransferase domain-containing protein [Planctomycetes bacterium]|nr:methyltransferase domain-containing protein [Planctomycetota bacterium]
MEEAPRRWEQAATVAAFAQAAPNRELLDRARSLLRSGAGSRCLDLGCGAGRNAVPLAQLGYDVTGVDRSRPMLDAARRRALQGDAARGSLRFLLGAMASLPFPASRFDLLVAHGVFNLAESLAEFRAALGESARVARRGAALFVVTFADATLAGADREACVRDGVVARPFNGQLACFASAEGLRDALASAGFESQGDPPWSAIGVDATSGLRIAGAPVLWQGWARRSGVRDA